MSKRKFTVGSRWILVSSWLGLLVYGCSSTPADDGQPGTGGGTSGSAGSGFSGTFSGSAGTTSGTAGVGVGGTPPTAGTGGTPPTAGTPSGGTAGTGAGGSVAGTGAEAGTSTGGTAGTPAAGTGPGGSAGAGGGASGVNMDAMCKSISNNAACTAAVGDGKACPMMPCGLGDSGRRDCNCQVNWTCTSCSYANSPIMTKPANAETPCSGVVNGMPCAMNIDSPLSVCNNSAATPDDPYCMCASDPRNPANPAEWNCDTAPSSW
jgi:hypothetical protein